MPRLEGGSVTLDALLDDGRPLLVYFADPVLPSVTTPAEVSDWQADHGSEIRIAIATRGSREENSEKFESSRACGRDAPEGPGAARCLPGVWHPECPHCGRGRHDRGARSCTSWMASASLSSEPFRLPPAHQGCVARYGSGAAGPAGDRASSPRMDCRTRRSRRSSRLGERLLRLGHEIRDLIRIGTNFARQRCERAHQARPGLRLPGEQDARFDGEGFDAGSTTTSPSTRRRRGTTSMIPAIVQPDPVPVPGARTNAR